MPVEAPAHRRNLEYGITTDGQPYLVMEYLEGPDFNSLLIARDPVLDGNRLHFIRQAAEAIAAVHAAGFIHRDICPRNFLLANGRQGPEADRLRPHGARHAAASCSRASAPAIPTTWPRRSSAASPPTSGSTSSPSA